MVVDKDTGRVYDLRNDRHVERLTESEIMNTTGKISVFPGSDPFEITESKSVLIRQETSNVNINTGAGNGKKGGSAWSSWWQKKKLNNDAMLQAAEKGDLQMLIKYLSPEQMLGQQADVNSRGLDQWTALHFSTKGGFKDAVEHILAQEGIDIEALSSMKRTPMHVAAEFDRDAIAKLLLDKGGSYSC